MSSKGKKRHQQLIKRQNSTTSTEPSEQNSPSGNVVKLASYQEIHEGPLPHPAILAGFDKVVPGSAERIIKMAEEQAKHRQDLEKIVIGGGNRDSLLGIICGFVISLFLIWVSREAILGGHAIEGTILGGTGIASLVGVFIYGTRSRRKERIEKDKKSSLPRHEPR